MWKFLYLVGYREAALEGYTVVGLVGYMGAALEGYRVVGLVGYNVWPCVTAPPGRRESGWWRDPGTPSDLPQVRAPGPWGGVKPPLG